MHRILPSIAIYVQEKRVLFTARREERRKFKERQAAQGRVNETGKEQHSDGDLGKDAAAEDGFDVSDGEWEAEEAYMKDAEVAWDYEKRHPQNCAVLHRDIDPMWFSKPLQTFTRSTDGPAAVGFINDINRRRVRTAPLKDRPLL
jgi:hypothetical protein